MARAILRNNHFEDSWPAAADIPVGQLVERHNKVYFTLGEDVVKAGEIVTGRTDVMIECQKQSAADVYAEDADVFWDPATQLVHTTDDVSRFKAGIARKASGAGETGVQVLLNF